MYICIHKHINTYRYIDMHISTYIDHRGQVETAPGAEALLIEGTSIFPRDLPNFEEAQVTTTCLPEANVTSTHFFKGDFKMRSRKANTKRNSRNHIEYKSLDRILSEISDPEELLEVQEFLETPIDELPEEVSSSRYFRRFAD
jgi:hypothetical protein